MRLIDADAIIETLNNSRWQDQSWIAKHHWAHAVQLKDYIVDALTVAPTINPEDLRPKGKWEQKRDHWNMFLSICSNCGRSEFLTPPYCAGCGAKMEMEG